MQTGSRLRWIQAGALELLAAGLAWTVASAGQGGSVLPPPLVERPGVAGRPWPPYGAAPQDTFPLAIIATIDSVVNGDVTFGDTDRDGLQEILSEQISASTFRWQLVIVEEQGDNTYEATYPLGLGVHVAPYATSDLDGDGKMEIVGQVESFIRIYESVDGTSFPSQLVWESPPLTNIGGKTATGDTDRDGRMELIHSRSGFGGTGGLVIFENTGDDAYVEVASLSMPGNAATYEKAIADLDGDGWPEIAACGNGGLLYIFEACGNDAWQTVWVDSTGLHNAYAAEGGWDTDGNGRPEIFIMGNNFEDATWDSRVYEACGDDQYRLVATLTVPNPNSGQPNDALGISMVTVMLST